MLIKIKDRWINPEAVTHVGSHGGTCRIHLADKHVDVAESADIVAERVNEALMPIVTLGEAADTMVDLANRGVWVVPEKD